MALTGPTVIATSSALANTTDGTGHDGTISLGTVATTELIVVVQGGTAANSGSNTVWTTPTKSAGTATIGAAVPIAESGSGSNYISNVRAWRIPVTGNGTLTINYGDAIISYGPGISVLKWTGHAATSIVGAIGPASVSAATLADGTLGATPVAADHAVQVTNWDTDAAAGKGVTAGTGFTNAGSVVGTTGNYVLLGVSYRTGSTSTTVPFNTQDGTTAVYSLAGIAFIVKAAADTGATGTFSVAEVADTTVITGTASAPASTGTLAVAEVADTGVVTGTASVPGTTGTVNVAEANDTIVATGTAGVPPSTGTVSATEAADTAVVSGTASTPAATAPGAPTALVVKPGDTEFYVGWTAPASDGGSPITGYFLEHNVNAAGWTTHTATTGTTLTYTFPQGYTVADSVQFRVSAINTVGTGTATAASTAAVAVERLFPVSVGAGVFDDQNGDPWLMIGDTPWSLAAQLSDAQVIQYIDNVAAKGINTILYNSIEHFYSDNAPNNIDDVAPFTGTAFQTGLTEAYWRRIDLITEYTRVVGITVIDCPAYLGFPGSDEGWDTEVNAASNTNMTTYGNTRKIRTLSGGGGTYGAQPHVIYLAGHDSEPDATEKARYAALIAAIKGPSQLVTIGAMSENLGTDGGDAAVSWASAGFSWDFNTIYLYDGNIAQDTRAIIAANGPAIFIEGRYPGEASGSAILSREQLHAAISNGALGSIHGSRPTWLFASGWQSDLDATSHVHLGIAADIYRDSAAIAESAAVDSTSTFVTAGRSSGTNEAGVRFGPNGALIYIPSSRALTVDLTELDGEWSTVNIVRYDPASGATSTLATGQATTATGYSIPTQGNNSAGDADWLFIVSGDTTQTASGSLAVADAADTGSLSGAAGTPPSAGSLGASETADTAVVSGTASAPGSTGTITVTDAEDSIGLTGSASPPASTGTIGVSEAADSIVATGIAGVPPSTGTVTAAEAADTIVVTGTAGVQASTGTLTAAEADDGATVTGEAAAPPGTVTVTEASDTAVITGTATAPPSTGTISVADAADTIVVSGTSSAPGLSTGTLSVVEAADTGTVTGNAVIPPSTGALNAVEAADTIVMYDTAVIAHGSAVITVTAPTSSITVTAPTASITVTKE